MGCGRTRRRREEQGRGWETGGVRRNGKKNEEKNEGRRRGNRRREGESPRYSLDDLCGSDAISEASLESGLSPGTSVLVNHRDPPTPVPCSARSQAPTRRDAIWQLTRSKGERNVCLRNCCAPATERTEVPSRKQNTHHAIFFPFEIFNFNI